MSETSQAVPRMAYAMAEAAEATRLSRTTLYSAINRGELTIVKIGDRTLIEPAELARWLRTKRRSAADHAEQQLDHDRPPRRRLSQGRA